MVEAARPPLAAALRPEHAARRPAAVGDAAARVRAAGASLTRPLTRPSATVSAPPSAAFWQFAARSSDSIQLPGWCSGVPKVPPSISKVPPIIAPALLASPTGARLGRPAERLPEVRQRAASARARAAAWLRARARRPSACAASPRQRGPGRAGHGPPEPARAHPPTGCRPTRSRAARAPLEVHARWRDQMHPGPLDTP